MEFQKTVSETSGGLIVALWVTMILLNPYRADQLEHVSAAILGGMASLVCLRVYVRFAMDKKSTQRRVNAGHAAYWFAAFIAHAWVAYDRIAGITHIPFFVVLLKDSTELMLASLLIIHRTSLASAFRHDDKREQAIVKQLDEIHQVHAGIRQTMRTQEVEANRLTEQIANVGRSG